MTEYECRLYVPCAGKHMNIRSPKSVCANKNMQMKNHSILFTTSDIIHRLLYNVHIKVSHCVRCVRALAHTRNILSMQIVDSLTWLNKIQMNGITHIAKIYIFDCNKYIWSWTASAFDIARAHTHTHIHYNNVLGVESHTCIIHMWMWKL